MPFFAVGDWITKGTAQRGRTEGAVLPGRRSAPEHDPCMTSEHSTTAWWNRPGVYFENKLLFPQVPQAQCEHGRQKCKDLYENPDKKLKKIIIWKKFQLKSLTRLPSWIASFLCGCFPDPTRFDPFHNFVVVNGYNKIPRLETKFSGATNLSQIFLG